MPTAEEIVFTVTNFPNAMCCNLAETHQERVVSITGELSQYALNIALQWCNVSFPSLPRKRRNLKDSHKPDVCSWKHNGLQMCHLMKRQNQSQGQNS